MTSGQPTIHASAVAIGDHGILIRGGSGAGKSALAMALIEDPRHDTTLVGDDRVILDRDGERLWVTPAPALAGLIELRGIGMLRRPHRERAVVRLAVDLLPEAQCPRLPDEAERSVTIHGVALPRLMLPTGLADGAMRVRVALREWL